MTRGEANKIAMLVIKYGSANRHGEDDSDLYDQIETKLFALEDAAAPAPQPVDAAAKPVAWTTNGKLDAFNSGKNDLLVSWKSNTIIGNVPLYTAPQPGTITAEYHQRMMEMFDYDGVAHEIWAAAQFAPGEAVEDAVSRVETLLREAVRMAYQRANERPRNDTERDAE